MSGIQVAQGQERFVKALADYTQDQCENKLEYITGQNTNGQKRAMDAVIYGLAAISTANVIEAGSSKRIIKKATHNARKNDVVQFTSGSSEGVSIQILSCPDANTMILAATSEFSISIGDTFDIKRYVTPQYDEDGALVVVATPGPTQYVYNGADTEVEEDTTVAANNRALPSKMFIQKDGVTQPLNKDTGVPSNTVAMPVEIVSASGTEINITAGDINIQTTSEGGSFDSMRIGSGVGLYAEITANSELSTHDQDAVDALDAQTLELQAIKAAVESIEEKTPALGQALPADSVPVALPASQITALTPPAAITGFALEGTLLDVEVAIQSIDGKTPGLGQALAAASVPVVLTAAQITTLTPPAAITGFALETTQAANGVLIGAVNETAPGTDTANSGLNGRLQRIAQRITSLIALIPTALGQGTMAQGLRVVLPSDQSAIPTNNTQQSVAGTITSTQATVGVAAVRATVAGTAPNAARKKLMVKPSKNNTGAIYIGASGVTTANGLEIIGPDRLEFEFDAGDYYLISDTAAQICEIVEKV